MPLSPRIVVATALLCLPLARASAGEKPRPMTVEDVMKVRHIMETAISPDGGSVVYVVSEADLKGGRYNTDLWLITPDKLTRKLTNGPGQDDAPRWSPDGKRIAFLSDRDGKTQLWVISPRGGEARKLTDSKTPVREPAWAPDGKRLAYLAADPDSEEEAKRKRDRADVVVVDRDIKMDHLHLVPAAGGASRRLTAGDFSVLNFCWSPDGKQIAYAAAPSRRATHLFHSDLHVLSVAEGQARPLVQREGLDAHPKWSPDGKQLAFLSSDGQPTWLGGLSVCVVPAAGGTPRNVSKGLDGVTPLTSEFYGWSADGQSIRLAVDTRATRQLFAVTVADGAVKPLTSGQRVHDRFSFGADGRRAAFLIDEPTGPREVCVTDLAKFQPQRLTRTNPQLAGIALGAVEPFRWKSFDGLEIHGLLIKPVGYRAGTRYPLLTYVHGGPALQFAHAFSVYPLGPPQASRYPVHVLAGQGYAIFCPNPRGSAGYGEKFRRANVKDWGGGDYRDIMTGVDRLIEQGLADPQRLGIMGWSYGGYMTSWVITQTDRFKAASAGAGVTNLVSMYGQTDIPAFLETYFAGVPWQQRELYAKHSAMSNAGKIKTPTLIQHGEKDERVPLAQSQELHAALKRNGVPVEFVVYPRQGHNPSEPQLQRDVLQRNVDWFNRWLRKR
jgi:dipeptidyl aminopeptidase/acylaminoacyl peptidase